VLVTEFDNTIQDILRESRSRKRKADRPLIFGAVLAVALIVMLILWALL
jgi:predicted nucleic acid-binding Zn ribbon protein